MFHPLPPNLGPGVYLGAVERATSFITDDLWYGIFAGTNPETFVRADGAFVPFADSFDVSSVTTSIKGIGEIDDVKVVDLQSPINSLIGKKVIKIGRSSGLTTGTVMAYALEYNDEKGICFLTDFLVVGENQQTFDLEGDSGSLILLTGDGVQKPRPIGIIWGGTANRGRLKLKNGQGPQNWTSGVDLGRLLDLLELDLVTSDEGLQDAFNEQRRSSAAAIGSAVGESSPRGYPTDGTLQKDRVEDIYEPLGLTIQHLPEVMRGSGISPIFDHPEFGVGVTETSVEHEFLPSSSDAYKRQPDHDGDMKQNTLSALKNFSNQDISIGLHIGERELKRPRCESVHLNEEHDNNGDDGSS
ncbi:unnamed protein product [Victoria cruziana]